MVRPPPGRVACVAVGVGVGADVEVAPTGVAPFVLPVVDVLSPPLPLHALTPAAAAATRKARRPIFVPPNLITTSH